MSCLGNIGKAAGLKWAITAKNWEYAQGMLEELERDLSGGIHHLLTLENAYSPAQNLFFLLHDVNWFDRDRSEAAAFWERTCVNPDPEMDYLLGFVLGVLDSDVALT